MQQPPSTPAPPCHAARWRAATIACLLVIGLGLAAGTSMYEQFKAQVAHLQGQIKQTARIKYIAVLLDAAQAPAMLATFDPGEGTLQLQRLNSVKEGREDTMQLWAVTPGQVPRSLGVLTASGKTHQVPMSEAALAAHRAGKVRVALGRGSDFFGPWALGSSHGERVFYPALTGKAASFGGKLDLPHTATYIEDFGKALAILGERDEALGQAWHVPNDRPGISQRQFAELVFAATGHPLKASGMGRLMLQLGGLFIPAARESVEMLYEFEKPFIVDSSKFERAFGVKATPIEQAIKTTVAWYRAHPQ